MKNLLREFNKIQSSIIGVYHEASAKLGVTDTEMEILYVLCTEENTCNQSSLYKKTGITKSTINSALHKMQKKGLIELKPGDGRNVRVLLTEQGIQLSKTTVYPVIEIENAIFGGWTKEEQDLFIRLNQRYLEEVREKVKAL